MITQTLRDRAVKEEVKDLADLTNREVVPALRATRNEVNRLLAPPVEITSDPGTLEIDWNASLRYKTTLWEDVGTILFKSPTFDRGDFTLEVVQPASYAFTGWPSSVEWASGTEPTLSSAQTYVLRFFFDGTAYIGWQEGAGSGAAITYGSVTGLTVGGANVDGVATSVSRSDHVHALAAYGTAAGTFCQGNDSRLSDARTPTGSAGGSLGGTYPNPTVAKINETSGPTTLTIGTIADGEYLKRSGSNLISGTPSGTGAGTGSTPLWVPPSSAGTADDEFDSTTLNVAYSWWDDTSATNRTPSGTPDPYTALTGATTVPAYDLHTNGRRSWLRVQVSDSNHVYWMNKSWSPATNVFLWARLRMTPRTTITTQGIVALEMHSSTGGHPNGSKRAYVGLLRDGTSGGARVFGDVVDTTGGSDSAGPSTTGNWNPEYFGIHRIGSNITLYAGGDGNWTALRPTKTSVTWTPDMICIRFQSGETVAPYLTFGVDFIREFNTATMPPF